MRTADGPAHIGAACAGDQFRPWFVLPSAPWAPGSRQQSRVSSTDAEPRPVCLQRSRTWRRSFAGQSGWPYSMDQGRGVHRVHPTYKWPCGSFSPLRKIRPVRSYAMLLTCPLARLESADATYSHYRTVCCWHPNVPPVPSVSLRGRARCSYAHAAATVLGSHSRRAQHSTDGMTGYDRVSCTRGSLQAGAGRRVARASQEEGIPAAVIIGALLKHARG